MNKFTEAQRAAMKRIAKASVIAEEFDSTESHILALSVRMLNGQINERYALEENEEEIAKQGEFMMAEMQEEAAKELREALAEVRSAFHMPGGEVSP